MNIVKKYIAYLNDNPEHLWFKRKLYGWGWAPATWQGWLITFMFVALMIGNAFRIKSNSYDPHHVPVEFIIETVILVIVLIGICWWKGEKVRWI